MDKIWTAVGETFQGHAYMEGRSTKGLAKLVSSALFRFGHAQSTTYTMTTTSCADDAPSGPAAVSCTPGSPVENGVTVFRDYVTKRRSLELTSMRAIHQSCLEEEATNMARAQLATKRWSDPKHVFSFRVDELVVRVGKDKVPKFVTAVEKITYADLADILPPGRTRAWQTPNTSTAPVFKNARCCRHTATSRQT